MQQFTVPQFIDVEDRIIGPITTRQFFISLTGLLLIFVAYRVADFSLFLVLAFVIAVVTGVVAFLRVNGRPFHEFTLDVFGVVQRPRVRIWKKLGESSDPIFEHIPSVKADRATARPPHAEARTIAELALLVDTGGMIHEAERHPQR